MVGNEIRERGWRTLTLVRRRLVGLVSHGLEGSGVEKGWESSSRNTQQNFTLALAILSVTRAAVRSDKPKVVVGRKFVVGVNAL
jgi:hypothetical protein